MMRIVACLIATGFAMSAMATTQLHSHDWLMGTPLLPYGWYLGLEGGWSVISHKTYPASVDGSGPAYGGNVGYKFSPFTAVEANYIRYSNVNIKSAGDTVARDRFYSYGINGKVMFPLCSSGASLFGKAGISRLQSDLQIKNEALAASSGLIIDTGLHYATGLSVGLGAEYSFSPYALVNIQAGRVFGNKNTGDADLYSLGLSYIF